MLRQFALYGVDPGLGALLILVGRAAADAPRTPSRSFPAGDARRDRAALPVGARIPRADSTSHGNGDPDAGALSGGGLYADPARLG